MFFELKFSFSLCFRLGGDATCGRDQSASDKAGKRPPNISQLNVKPSPVINTPVAASTPTRPAMPEFARHVRGQRALPRKHILETNDTHIADTLRSRASDRESLQILLRWTKKQDQPTSTTPFNTDIAGKLSASSFEQISPVMFSNMPSEDPFVSTQSPVCEDDSGSDLVSSLQRLRVGGLASYFQEVDDRVKSSSSSPTKAPADMESSASSAAAEEEDRSSNTQGIDSEEWEVVVNKPCWKKHRHADVL